MEPVLGQDRRRAVRRHADGDSRDADREYEVASDYSLYSDQDIASGYVEPYYNCYVSYFGTVAILASSTPMTRSRIARLLKFATPLTLISASAIWWVITV